MDFISKINTFDSFTHCIVYATFVFAHNATEISTGTSLFSFDNYLFSPIQQQRLPVPRALFPLLFKPSP